MAYIVKEPTQGIQPDADDKEYDLFDVVVEKDINGVDQQMPRLAIRNSLRRLRAEKQALQDRIAVLNAQIDQIVAFKNAQG